VIVFLHGEDAYLEAVKISESLFSGAISNLSQTQLEDAFKGIPSSPLASSISLVDLLTEQHICSSKREAREFIRNGSITLNGNKITDEDFVVTKELTLYSKYIILRRGKKKYYVFYY